MPDLTRFLEPTFATEKYTAIALAPASRRRRCQAWLRRNRMNKGDRTYAGCGARKDFFCNFERVCRQNFPGEEWTKRRKEKSGRGNLKMLSSLSKKKRSKCNFFLDFDFRENYTFV